MTSIISLNGNQLIYDRENIQRSLREVPLPNRLVNLDEQTINRIKNLLRDNNAAIIAHYYTDSSVQKLAEVSGGFVGDSLEMAIWGQKSQAKKLIIAGVKFMGESAKILNSEKDILMPNLEATCSLDLTCPSDEFIKWRNKYPDRIAVVYANTSAVVKANADWVVTSSIALPIVRYLQNQGNTLLWAPDKHLGQYIKKNTGADMLMWDGACVVHEEFQAQSILDLKEKYPQAAVLAHPESPNEVLELADTVGSTSQLISASKNLKQQQLIVATEKSIFYKMQQAVPEKILIEATRGGTSASCRSCSMCPWMGMNSVKQIENLLDGSAVLSNHQIEIDEEIINRSKAVLQKMIDFKHKYM